MPLAPPTVAGFPDPWEAVPAPEPERPFVFVPEVQVAPVHVPDAEPMGPVYDGALQRVLMVGPGSVRVFSGATLVLGGAEFTEAAMEGALCTFGTTVSPVTFVSAQELTCPVPPADSPGVVAFSLSAPALAVGLDFAGTSLVVDQGVQAFHLHYLPRLELAAASPALGPDRKSVV